MQCLIKLMAQQHITHCYFNCSARQWVLCLKSWVSSNSFMHLAPRFLSLLIGKISDDLTTSFICYKSDLSANVLARLPHNPGTWSVGMWTRERKWMEITQIERQRNWRWWEKLSSRRLTGAYKRKGCRLQGRRCCDEKRKRGAVSKHWQSENLTVEP